MKATLSMTAVACALVILAVLCSLVSTVEATDALEALRGKFTEAVDTLAERKGKRDLDAKYEAQLQALMRETQQTGDLDRLLLVKSEAAEFRIRNTKIVDGFPELMRLQQIYREALTRITAQEDASRLKLFEGYSAELQELQARLVRGRKIEEAVQVRREREEIVRRAALLPRPPPPSSDPRKWVVLFRSSNPRLWNSDTDDERGFARTLSSASRDTKYLRMRNLNKTVIVPMTYDQLPMHVDLGDGIKWNGAAMFDSRTLRGKRYETTVLGIGSAKWYRRHGMKAGIVTVEKRDKNRRPEGLGGWGFSRNTNFYAAQGFQWAGKPCDGPFEIAVSSQPLTIREAEMNLVKSP